MNPLNIVFLDALHYPPNYQIKKPNFPHTWTAYPVTKADQVFERSKDADILIASKVILDRAMLKRLADNGKLRLVQIPATGTNNVDLEAAKEFGITVQNVEGYSSNSVAEHVIAFIFAMARSFHGWSRDQLSANWTQQEIFTYYDYPIYDVAGKTLTIVGRGNIGNLVAEKAQALGMRVLFAERHDADELRQGYTEFRQAIGQADFITLHCPLTPSTTELVNDQFLRLMKRTAFLINTGRGGLINEKDLANALKDRRIGGAALDVLSLEPPTMDNPLVQAGLDAYNLFITPHNAFAGQQSLRTLADLMIDRIDTFVAQNYKF
ncbi:NAD(P)-dependent oxidoreductase [Psittacicella hinzii]|uniref:Glycerate dehydrogenase n=1 Tax=Psittacicella hinzii TaxID=2028575 RepID=A0A3A1YVQ3_9GAMM|nr:NAD(P)-dependent oxidoreductase [Psittacicella hinzii]RIY40147.1 hypothetical protein CKF58_01025 [Psittacicella hinzii]